MIIFNDIGWQEIIIFAIICNAIMASIFRGVAKKSTFDSIVIIVISAFSVGIIMFHHSIFTAVSLIVVLGFIYFRNIGNKSVTRVLELYATVAILLIIMQFKYSSLPQYAEEILFYIMMALIIGLLPFQSWYLKVFEKTSLNILSVFIVFQAVLLWHIQSLFHLEHLIILHWMFAILSLITSCLAIVQNNIRRLLPYLISSQMGFLVFSHLSTSETMLFGSNYLLLTIVIVTSSLVLIIGSLEARQGLGCIRTPNGNYDSYPKLASFLLIFGLISSGFPISIGYMAEDLVFEGNFNTESIVDIIWIMIIAINNISIMKIFLYLCNGKNRKETGLDLKRVEIIFLYFILIFIAYATFLIS